MDSNELKKLIKEPENRAAEDENRRLVRGDVVAGSIGYLVGIAMILLELFVKKRFDYGLCTVLFTYSSIGQFSEGSKTGKWWRIAIGVLCALVALLMLITFLGTVVFA